MLSRTLAVALALVVGLAQHVAAQTPTPSPGPSPRRIAGIALLAGGAGLALGALSFRDYEHTLSQTHDEREAFVASPNLYSYELRTTQTDTWRWSRRRWLAWVGGGVAAGGVALLWWDGVRVSATPGRVAVTVCARGACTRTRTRTYSLRSTSGTQDQDLPRGRF
jgi:hypothetical protein